LSTRDVGVQLSTPDFVFGVDSRLLHLHGASDLLKLFMPVSIWAACSTRFHVNSHVLPLRHVCAPPRSFRTHSEVHCVGAFLKPSDPALKVKQLKLSDDRLS